MIETENIFVYFMNMDIHVPEQVVKNKDGTYSIFLNSRLTYESNMQSYRHAIEHIINGDFEGSDTNKIESKGHNLDPSKELRMYN
ncbi:hypothetical protein PMF13cell1_00780 [Blautia producta]|uniref:ImmA/IrrE family metallo-endopeptidase n=1 Tax=Blautia producta TaxID=33035 RepID=A0A4P6LUD3_9FIRM|nr:hypothetical protein [Blautia producta]QBE95265.1 hypothetical protein PMF13cell1_00780 [Blautia producta]